MLTRSAGVAALDDAPLALRLAVDSHERRNRGLKLDWVRFDLGERAVVRAATAARVLPALFATFLFALFRFGGLGAAPSLALVATGLACTVAAQRLDPFATLHALRQLAVPGAVVAVAGALVLRRLPLGQWAVPILVAGFLLRGAGLFHPAVFYPDVENARDYVDVFRTTEGWLAERGVATQERTNVGYPRTIGGKDYAFPYSPLYFAPFQLFDSPGAIQDAVRHVGLAAATLAILPVFWLALTAFGPSAGLFAAALWTVSPPVTSRLLLALHATVVGNALDLVVIVAVVLLALHPQEPQRLVHFGLAALASMLAYTSSLFSVSAFVLFAAAVHRSLAVRLLAVTFVCGTVTVTWLYWPFLSAFFTEIVPALASGGGGPVPDAEDSSPALVALSRIPLFYGFATPALAAMGLVLAKRHAEPAVYRTLVAWALAFALLLSLRAFGAGLFKDLKETTFVAPLVAVLAGGALSALASRAPRGRLIAGALLLWLLAFGLGRYRGYLETYASAASPPGQTSALAPSR